MKMINVRDLARSLTVLSVSIVLTACGGISPHKEAVTETLPFKDYEEFKSKAPTPELQKIATDSFKEDLLAAEAWNYMLYLKGDKVCYNEGASCIQLNVLSMTTSVWDSHSTGAWGTDNTVVQTFKVDSEFRPIEGDRAQMAKAISQAGLGRYFTSLVVNGVLSPVLNNSLAAEISNCEECGKASVFTTIVTEVTSESSLTGKTGK